MPGVTSRCRCIPGCDGIGEIAALGEGVADLRLGQKVRDRAGLSPRAVGARRARQRPPRPTTTGSAASTATASTASTSRSSARFVFPLPAGLDPVRRGRGAARVPDRVGHARHARAACARARRVLVLGRRERRRLGRDPDRARPRRARVRDGRQRGEARRSRASSAPTEVVDHATPRLGQAQAQAPDRRRAASTSSSSTSGRRRGTRSMRVLARNGRLVTCGATTGPDREARAAAPLHQEPVGARLDDGAARRRCRRSSTSVASGVYQPGRGPRAAARRGARGARAARGARGAGQDRADARES